MSQADELRSQRFKTGWIRAMDTSAVQRVAGEGQVVAPSSLRGASCIKTGSDRAAAWTAVSTKRMSQGRSMTKSVQHTQGDGWLGLGRRAAVTSARQATGRGRRLQGNGSSVHSRAAERGRSQVAYAVVFFIRGGECDGKVIRRGLCARGGKRNGARCVTA